MQTQLHNAVINDHVAAVKTLLQAGARVDTLSVDPALVQRRLRGRNSRLMTHM